MAAKQGFLSTILNGDAAGTKMSVRHRQGGCSSEVAVKRGSTVQTKKHYIKSLLLDKRSCFSQSKTSTVQLTIEHVCLLKVGRLIGIYKSSILYHCMCNFR